MTPMYDVKINPTDYADDYRVSFLMPSGSALQAERMRRNCLKSTRR